MAMRLSPKGKSTHPCATSASAQTIAPYFEKNSPNDSSGLVRLRLEAEVISVVIRLLRFAAEALPRNQDETRQYIESAIALLKGGCDPRDTAEDGCGSLPKPLFRPLAPWQIDRVASF